MKYIHYFGTEAAYNQERNNNYIEPWVSYTVGKGIDYNKVGGSEQEEDYSVYLEMPFTIEALGSGEISWDLGELTVEYSKNNGPWITMDSETTISVVQGDEIAFLGENNMYSYYDDNDEEYFSRSLASSARFNAKGNIMSLTDGDNFENASSVDDFAFFELFFSSPIVSAKYLMLPADSLSNSCYYQMFMNCTNLVYPPKLPATELMNYCYSSMFQGCSALLTAPDLPATTLATSCYYCMFEGCGSLVSAPELPATTLESYCYSSMFRDCTNLEEAPELPATTLELGCYSGMFRGCTSIEESPVLPATTLVGSCYNNMFRSCSSLSRITAMFTTAPGTTYTNGWVNGVAASGIFIKNAAATWTTTGVSGVPTGWTVQTASE